jgi:hypothetical protein
MVRETDSPEAASRQLPQARAKLAGLRALLWVAGAPGALVALAGAGVIAWQVATWIAQGAWEPVPLAVLAPRLPGAVGAWLVVPRGWPGFPTAAPWSLGEIPLAFVLLGAGTLLFILLWAPVADAAKRERNRVEWLDVRARQRQAGPGPRPPR